MKSLQLVVATKAFPTPYSSQSPLLLSTGGEFSYAFSPYHQRYKQDQYPALLANSHIVHEIQQKPVPAP